MDYKDLANLIFPDAKTIEFYEKKYPERNLPEGAMVVRIGPSPTGSVHIGTIYQALIARTLADKTNGVFFLKEAFKAFTLKASFLIFLVHPIKLPLLLVISLGLSLFFGIYSLLNHLLMLILLLTNLLYVFVQILQLLVLSRF